MGQTCAVGAPNVGQLVESALNYCERGWSACQPQISHVDVSASAGRSTSSSSYVRFRPLARCCERFRPTNLLGTVGFIGQKRSELRASGQKRSQQI